MTSDNPTANCVPNSNCSHGNFKYREDFPASLRREGSEYLALLGLMGPAGPAGVRPRGHGGTAVPRIHLGPGSCTQTDPCSTHSHCPLLFSGRCNGFGLLERQTAALGPAASSVRLCLDSPGQGEFFIFISCCSQPHPPLFTGSEPPALYCCLRIQINQLIWYFE